MLPGVLYTGIGYLTLGTVTVHDFAGLRDLRVALGWYKLHVVRCGLLP